MWIILWDPILKLYLRFSIFIDLVNSARDPQKKCQIQILFLFNAIQTYTKWVFGSTLSCVSRLCFPFFFFFFFVIIHLQQLLGDYALFIYYSLLFVQLFTTVCATVHYYLCNIHQKKKYILKIGPTILFTHLKIILLKYFQFQQK